MKCPYFLEHCITTVLSSFYQISQINDVKQNKIENKSNSSHDNSSNNSNNNNNNNNNNNISDILRNNKGKSAFSSFIDIKYKNVSSNPHHQSYNKVQTQTQTQTQSNSWSQVPWGSVNVPSAVLTPSSSECGLQSLWLTLRLIRGVPSEVLHAMSDRLGAGVLSILWWVKILAILNHLKWFQITSKWIQNMTFLLVFSIIFN